MTLHNLTPNTRYYYRAKARGDSVYLTDTGEMNSFTTLLSSTVSTLEAEYVSTDSALLKGQLLTRGSSDRVNVWFEWGMETEVYPNSTAVSSMDATGEFDFLLDGLESGRMYYFRAASGGDTTGTAYGDEKTFITTTIPPEVRTLEPVWTSDTTLTLYGELASMGTADNVDVGFIGGPVPGDSSFALVPYTFTAPASFSLDVADMQTDTAFYVRAVAYGGVSGIDEGTEIRTIRCSEQTFGTNCTPCPDCDHGACDVGVAGGGQCDCEEGWTGATCRVGICDPVCVHGICTEPNVCSCEAGWSGTICSAPVCDPPCVNGTCTAPDACSCNTGWQGAACDSAICQTPCDENATCIGPDTCACNEGYFGDGFDCEPITECTAALDWTPCADGACFSHVCEPLGENDRCEDAIALDVGTDYFGNFKGFHAYYTVPASCGGTDLSGADSFYTVALDAGMTYRISATPSASLDVAMVLWTQCHMDAVNCFASTNGSETGGVDSLTIEPEQAATYIVQVLALAIAQREETSGYTLLVSELSADGDLEADGDLDEDMILDGDFDDEVIVDGDVETHDDEESLPDGDELIDGDAMDIDRDVAADGDMDTDDYAPDGDWDTDNSTIDGDVMADGDDPGVDDDDGSEPLIGGASGGGCQATFGTGDGLLLIGVMISGLLLAIHRRKRRLQ